MVFNLWLETNPDLPCSRLRKTMQGSRLFLENRWLWRSSCKVVIRSNRFFSSQFNVFNWKFSWKFQGDQFQQVYIYRIFPSNFQVTEDNKEQESDSGEEETQVWKRKSSILRSIIHILRCKRFQVSREDAKELSEPNSEQNDLWLFWLLQYCLFWPKINHNVIFLLLE